MDNPKFVDALKLLQATYGVSWRDIISTAANLWHVEAGMHDIIVHPAAVEPPPPLPVNPEQARKKNLHECGKANPTAKDCWRRDHPVASAREDPAAERAEWAAEKAALAASDACPGPHSAQALLGTASEAGDLAGVKRAIASGADPNRGCFDMDGCVYSGCGGDQTAAFVAAANGELRVLRWLLCAAGADPNNTSDESVGLSSSGKYTPCAVACLNAYHDVARVLVARGATADHSTSSKEGSDCRCPSDIPHPEGACKCLKCKSL